MPTPMPPAKHRHGNGDRNDAHVAEVDHHLQEPRDAGEAKDAREAGRAAKQDEGFDHP